MKKKYFLIICFLFLSLLLSAKSLKILWWNVENLFDTIDDPYKGDMILSIEEYSDGSR